MNTFIATFLTFLVTHQDLIQAIWDALDSGRTKAEIMADIKRGMVAGSDAAVEAQLGPRP